MVKYLPKWNPKTKEKWVEIVKTGEIVKENDDPIRYRDLRDKAWAAQRRKQKSDMLKSLGLIKVKSAMGRTYWE